MAKILVTGATGFIGKRLVHALLEEGHEVWALSRIRGIGLGIHDSPRLHMLYGDLAQPTTCDPFPSSIEVAYYLVHSLGDGASHLVSAEEAVAQNFITALGSTTCRQIIFLGGIIEEEHALSPHLRSRLAVENVLKRGNIPVTILRSSIIIGAGSASFEIIRDLVEKLPIMVAPRWVASECQPISIKDVLFYLTGVLLHPACYGKTFDIGGPDVFTFRELLYRYAAFRKLKRHILQVPLLTPRLSSYWLVLISSVRFSICRHLVESMKQHTRKRNITIDTILPHPCLTFDAALTLAFQKIAQNAVVSTWMDAWNPSQPTPSLEKYIEVPKEGCLRDVKVIPLTIPIEEVQRRVWSLGGNRGWYSLNWAWRLRGLIDQFVGGTGLNRGRRHPSELEVGDSVDFWRVLLADTQRHHLILYAEMKLPGEAWLEFEIDAAERVLKQTATFRPRGFLGRLYWYALVPFHGIIFNKLAKTLAQKMFVL